MRVLCLYRVHRRYPVKTLWRREAVVIEVKSLSDVSSAFELAVHLQKAREADSRPDTFVEFELTGFIPEQRGGL